MLYIKHDWTVKVGNLVNISIKNKLPDIFVSLLVNKPLSIKLEHALADGMSER